MLPNHLAFEKSVVLLETCCILERKKNPLAFLALGIRNHWHQAESFGKLKFFPNDVPESTQTGSVPRSAPGNVEK